MNHRLTRRSFTIMLGAGMAASLMPGGAARSFAQTGEQAFAQRLADIEAGLQGRLGVAVLDTASGRRWLHRGNERFPMCSTFKVVACGAVLARVDAGEEDLDRRIVFAKSDLVTYSPVTETKVGGKGMTLAEICEAAMTESDNTAGNIILDSLGGPAAVTAFARSLGDPATRLDRIETDLNEATPGDPRDTTTPDGMTTSLAALAFGGRLSPASTRQLTGWMRANKTGDARLRAGVPKDWDVGDKTGTGDRGTANDVAILYPPKREPVIVSVYVTETEAAIGERNAAIAEVGRAVAAALGT
ncbi:class A beta-lactamase [Aurantimonas sp. HBX-1]|uniref:class A beta-lactamase n=1 Tax=Aurantimonas sp. HBX-1 TaxID=2906072 RepID=UPI001EFEF326|nr:class A beta-lactamase [Aurantimonas sp. HBX-1]UIJ70976.1 class A beta-lactamase [Aurantimonas sp. HBX-1]